MCCNFPCQGLLLPEEVFRCSCHTLWPVLQAGRQGGEIPPQTWLFPVALSLAPLYLQSFSVWRALMWKCASGVPLRLSVGRALTGLGMGSCWVCCNFSRQGEHQGTVEFPAWLAELRAGAVRSAGVTGTWWDTGTTQMGLILELNMFLWRLHVSCIALLCRLF